MSATDNTIDADTEASWQEVIDRRSREIEEGKVICRSVDQTVQDIRAKLRTYRQHSKPAKLTKE